LLEPVVALTAGQDFRPFRGRVLYQADGVLHRLALKHRPDLDPRLQAVADLQLPGRVYGHVGELLLDVLVDEEPRRRDADLAVIAEFADDGRLGHRLRVRIWEDDEGRVPAQLQAEAFHLSGGRAHELLTNLGRSGEADLADVAVLDELVRDLPGRPDDQV